MPIHVVVLNYNGRPLLAECLPSVVRAAAASRHPCEVAVIDNSSTDGSLEYVRTAFPQVHVYEQPNRGLCSFNPVLEELAGPVAILLNNDIKLAEDCLDPLVEPLLPGGTAGIAQEDETLGCFMTAPLCWLFDGQTYEGLKTAVRWRWGLVQATSLYPKHDRTMLEPGLTASAGAVLAVDRRRFLALGGFDPLYLPGRLEDLDFAFRGYQAGGHALYVPASVAFHRGQASFGPAFGDAGCRALALRNTLLFQWKNLRHPWHVARQLGALPLRIGFDLVRAAWAPRGRRFAFTRALFAALPRMGQCLRSKKSPRRSWRREADFFHRLDYRRIDGPQRVADRNARSRATSAADPLADDEAVRARNYPLSRWYLRPLAGRLAALLAPTAVRPWCLTLSGLMAGLLAAAVLIVRPAASPVAGLLVLLAWFFDRTDGQLARRQKTASPYGAWLDANIDELVDLGLHIAVASAASSLTASTWPWAMLIAFLFGKYLLMYGVGWDQLAERVRPGGAHHRNKAQDAGLEAENVQQATTENPDSRLLVGSAGADSLREPVPPYGARPVRSALWSLYHFPANADVRVHLLAVALVTGCLTAELAIVAAYYNFRWVARYLLVSRRAARLRHLEASS